MQTRNKAAKPVRGIFCQYINLGRLLEVLPDPTALQRDLVELGDINEYRLNVFQRTYLERKIGEWVVNSNVQPLERLIVTKHLRVGAAFTCLCDFYFSEIKGSPSQMHQGRAILRMDGEYKSLQVPFDANRVTQGSHKFRLRGHQGQVVVIGHVQSIRGSTITGKAIGIGDLKIGRSQSLVAIQSGRLNYGEVYAGLIDQFSRIMNKRLPRDICRLKEIPEAQIKRAFAEIIGEPCVPKDWGGETSDLFSAHLKLEGDPINSAFLFKGPAKFTPMTLKMLGKNGDQLVRLFNEPAELLVIQHCHSVSTAVRRTIRAFSNEVGNLRKFCVIDGLLTMQILKAYKKCGL